jgi:phosphoribosylanthranilate isomerase
VFVDATIDEMNATAETANLDLLQLHGDEPAAMLEQLSRPVVKAFRPPAGASVDQLGSVIRQYQQVANAPVAYLIDGYAAHAAGGEGVRADWQLAAALAEVFPIFLAGGLDPETVGAAIAAVRPLAVDVSSGVETDGVKDLAKIVTFVEAARQGFRL